MGEFAECLEGIKEACEFLNYPVVSGNVSFYNGTNKKNISPTPVIGGVGLIKKLSKPLGHNFTHNNSTLLVIANGFAPTEIKFLQFSQTICLPPDNGNDLQ